MQVLEYNDLDYSGLETKYQKVKSALEAEDYYTAQVKKLRSGENKSLYAARLDYTNRVLFKFVKYQNQKYILILEIIRNHDYDGAKFLNGAKVVEEKADIISADTVKGTEVSKIIEEGSEEEAYINSNEHKFYFLDKLISFDESQSLVYSHSLPIVIIGSAGSGKTVLSLEKMKQLHGHILYISQSSYLVDNAQSLYFSYRYKNDYQEINFLSYNEFLESIRTFDNNSKICSYKIFRAWYERHRNTVKINDPEKVFEEIKGTITGIGKEGPYLTKEQYLDLGVKQTLFLQEEKERVYQLFQKYLEFIKDEGLIDINLLSHEYLKLVQAQYDYVVIDEIQDLTTVQIELILATLKDKNKKDISDTVAKTTSTNNVAVAKGKHNFLFCGDSNQIVHPNFFSWAKIKSLLYKDTVPLDKDILFLLTTNYRNSKKVTNIANKVLKIKQRRFGSIDKESNYLVQAIDENESNSGSITFIRKKERQLEKLNKASKKSTRGYVEIPS